MYMVSSVITIIVSMVYNFNRFSYTFVTGDLASQSLTEFHFFSFVELLRHVSQAVYQ